MRYDRRLLTEFWSYDRMRKLPRSVFFVKETWFSQGATMDGGGLLAQ